MSRWHLLGLGAIGTLAASRLLAAGHNVSVMPHQPASVVSRTLLRPHQPPLTLSLPCAGDEPVARLLLTVKAADTATALMPWLSHLTPGCELVCLQNGMGTLEGIELPTDINVIYASTTDGAWRDGDRIQVVAENDTLMGNDQPRAPDWFASLVASWPGLHWQADMTRARWRKLAVNAVINPLTARYRCRNGELLDGGERQQHMALLAGEVDALCARLLPGWDCDTLARSQQVAAQTAANTSSMLADVLAGRGTEIDYINGFLLRRAVEAGLDLPTHRHILAEVKALTS